MGQADARPSWNTTVVGSTEDGIEDYEPETSVVANCILWNNGDDLLNALSTYSNVEDGDPGEGNISEAPLFVDSSNSDLHILPESPCVDAGSNDAAGLPATDFEGEDRIADGDQDGTATVDMGADELVVPCQDADGDGYEDEACGGEDCDDGDPFVNPGQPEVPENGIDDDCDGKIDEACFIGSMGARP